MKTINKLMRITLPMLALAVLTGCAAGAATAGYSLKSQSADSLTAAAEQKIVDRTKREILSELSNDYMQKQCVTPERL